MIEIRNLKKHPVQLIIRSRLTPKSFTVLNIPGIGNGKNIFNLEEERSTEYIDRAQKAGLISTRYLVNSYGRGEKNGNT
jgi:hypothetical protein